MDVYVINPLSSLFLTQYNVHQALTNLNGKLLVYTVWIRNKLNYGQHFYSLSTVLYSRPLLASSCRFYYCVISKFTWTRNFFFHFSLNSSLIPAPRFFLPGHHVEDVTIRIFFYLLKIKNSYVFTRKHSPDQVSHKCVLFSNFINCVLSFVFVFR